MMQATSRWFPAAAVIVLAACTSQDDIEEIKRNQALLKSNQGEIKESQRRILERLDRIDGRLKAKPTPRREAQQTQQPGKPDPSKTYSFAAGDSPSKGPEDAWVTVVEVSEFQ